MGNWILIFILCVLPAFGRPANYDGTGDEVQADEQQVVQRWKQAFAKRGLDGLFGTASEDRQQFEWFLNKGPIAIKHIGVMRSPIGNWYWIHAFVRRNGQGTVISATYRPYDERKVRLEVIRTSQSCDCVSLGHQERWQNELAQYCKEVLTGQREFDDSQVDMEDRPELERELAAARRQTIRQIRVYRSQRSPIRNGVFVLLQSGQGGAILTLRYASTTLQGKFWVDEKRTFVSYEAAAKEFAK